MEKIDIPKQFLDEFTSDVKVILFKSEYNDTASKVEGIKSAKGFGALAHKANPDLWKQENI